MSDFETRHVLVRTESGIANFVEMGGMAVFSVSHAVTAKEEVKDSLGRVEEVGYVDPDFSQEATIGYISVNAFVREVSTNAA